MVRSMGRPVCLYIVQACSVAELNKVQNGDWSLQLCGFALFRAD